MAKTKSKGLTYFMGLLGFILIGVSSWAFYGLINQGIGDGLALIGVTNIYLQYGIVITIVLIGLVLVGAGFFRALETIIKK